MNDVYKLFQLSVSFINTLHRMSVTTKANVLVVTVLVALCATDMLPFLHYASMHVMVLPA